MKCKNCNSELNENARFCRYCGEKVEKEINNDAPKYGNDAVTEILAETGDTGVNEIAEADSGSQVIYIDENGETISSDNDGKKKRGSKKAKIIIIIILCAVLPFILIATILIGIVAYFLFNNGFDDFGDIFNFAKKEESPYEQTDDSYDTDDWYSDTQSSPDTDFYYGGIPSGTVSGDVSFEEDTEDTEDSYFEEEETTVPETTEADTEVPGEIIRYNDNRRVVIANGGLRIRNTPDLNGSIAGLIPNGTIITVQRFENNWAYTNVGGVYGWCSCDYLFVPFDYTGAPIYTATVTCYGSVEMISEDYLEADIVYTDVPNGQVVDVFIVDGDRAFIKYANIYGWCPVEYLVVKDVY